MTVARMMRVAAASAMLLAAPTAFMAAPAAAAAQEVKSTKAGPVYVKNGSGQALKLGNLADTDAAGVEQTIRGTSAFTAGESAFLNDAKAQKVVARKAKFELTSDAGTTTLTWTCRGLDADGDFVCELTAADYAKHLELLGKAAPAPVAAPKRADGPTPKEVENGVVKALLALVQHLAIQEIDSNPDPTIFQLILAQTLRGTRDETIGSAIKDLSPQLTGAESATVRRMVCLGFDGQLTPANLTALEAKEKLVGDLRAVNPDIASAAEVADFLYQIQNKRR